jgi:hypothetical protein
MRGRERGVIKLVKQPQLLFEQQGSPVCPQVAQTRRRRRRRTLTMTPSTLKRTSMTDAPGRRSSRLNAVVTRKVVLLVSRCRSNSQQPAAGAAARHPELRKIHARR